MQASKHETLQPASSLARTLTLRGALTLNLLDMIGVGPFITLPLLMGAMGGPQAMLGWLLGALLAVCDGLVWAELGAAMPEAGGTYAYLRGIYAGRLGRWLSFLFVFQLCFSAPLSVASGCIGLSQYAGSLLPHPPAAATVHAAHLGAYTFAFTLGWQSLFAMAAVGFAVLLLYRNLAKVEPLSRGLLLVVLGAIAWTVVTAMLHGQWNRVIAFPAGAFHPNHAFFTGLGSAMLVATYDFWGYYNVTFLGGEVRDPGRSIPRALLLSIAIVTVLYLLLNASVLALIGAPTLVRMAGTGNQPALLTAVMQSAYAPSFGVHGALWLGRLAALLVMITAFGSVFALLLGYSRIPFAAARDGNFFAQFGRLHPTRGFPHISLLTLAGVACVCCCFSLRDVIAALVVLRILLQFGLQQVGVILLRIRHPDLPRPFRIWLYPLPPLVAMLGFGFVVFSRANFSRELVLGGLVVIAGSVCYLWWERKHPPAALRRSVSGTV
ncbi:MAG: APC family permease [Janthinobacterium lividum]